MKKIFFAFAIFSNILYANAQIKTVINPNEKWVWYAPETPEVQIVVKDSLLKALSSEISLVVTTDMHQPVATLTQNISVANGDSAVLNFKPAISEPGFYNCRVLADGKNVVDFEYNLYGNWIKADCFNIAYEPQNIVSLPDNLPDLKEFWDRARAELATVEPHFQMKEMPEKSSKYKKYYHATMLSLGGDTVQAYVTIPTGKGAKAKTYAKLKAGKYPVHIIYMGYNSDVFDLNTDDNEFIQIEVSVRGQALNKPTNKYGDWIQWKLENPEEYYYRGAFMDCVRAIDFACWLPQADISRLYAEGGSQGGAFTMAAAALDDRLAAVCPYITFLSDYPHYFKIVSWPADPVINKAHQLGMSEEQMYRNLSYFDIKNLARWIDCPVYMGVGLQDVTCPNHTNFAGFNLVNAPKDYHVYPHFGHHVDYDHWSPAILEWFNKYAK